MVRKKRKHNDEKNEKKKSVEEGKKKREREGNEGKRGGKGKKGGRRKRGSSGGQWTLDALRWDARELVGEPRERGYWSGSDSGSYFYRDIYFTFLVIFI